MKRRYIKPQAQIYTFAGDAVMAEPALHVASGTFKEGEDVQLSKKFSFDDESGLDLAHFVPWRDID